MFYGRVTLALPIEPDVEVRVMIPRHMTADQWARMVYLLEQMRPGIVKLPAGNDAEGMQK